MEKLNILTFESEQPAFHVSQDVLLHNLQEVQITLANSKPCNNHFGSYTHTSSCTCNTKIRFK